MFKLVRKTKEAPPRRVCVLGVGNGGCRAMEHVIGGSGAVGTLAVMNTDAVALAGSQATTRIQIGRQGGVEEGTGGRLAIGREAAEQDLEMIRGLFSDCNVLILVTCLGGGTGSGASPVVLKAARAAGLLTLVVATLPFGFEGEERKRVAATGLKAMQEAADFVSVIHNDRLFAAAGMDGHLDAAFARADEALAAGVCCLWHVLMQPMLIGLDPGDLRLLAAKGSGACLYGFGTGSGVGRAEAAAEALVQSPAFEGGEALKQSGAALVCICGSHDMTLTEVSEVITKVTAALPADCSMRMGTVIHEGWRDRIFVTVFSADRKRKVTAVLRGAAASRPEKVRRSGSARGSGGNRPKVAQEELKFEGGDRGRFNSMTATILDGEDLDLPTFIRQGIVIER